MSEQSAGYTGLIEKIQAGEEKALNELCARLWPIIRAYCDGVGRGDLYGASDLAQSVLLVVSKKVEAREVEYRSEPQFLRYLRVVVGHAAQKKRRKAEAAKRRGQKRPLEEGHLMVEDTVADGLEINDLYQHITESYRHLSPTQQSIVEWTVQGVPVKEMAERLKLGERQVQLHRQRAYEILREVLLKGY